MITCSRRVFGPYLATRTRPTGDRRGLGTVHATATGPRSPGDRPTLIRDDSWLLNMLDPMTLCPPVFASNRDDPIMRTKRTVTTRRTPRYRPVALRSAEAGCTSPRDRRGTERRF